MYSYWFPAQADSWDHRSGIKNMSLGQEPMYLHLRFSLALWAWSIHFPFGVARKWGQIKSTFPKSHDNSCHAKRAFIITQHSSLSTPRDLVKTHAWSLALVQTLFTVFIPDFLQNSVQLRPISGKKAPEETKSRSYKPSWVLSSLAQADKDFRKWLKSQEGSFKKGVGEGGWRRLV